MNKKILTVTLNPAIDFTIEVPGFTLDSVNKAIKSRRDPGGKGINVATALSTGGIDTHVTGFLGKDNREIFTNHFKEHNITDNFVYVQGSTRECIKIADIKNKITTDINFSGIDLQQNELNEFIGFYSETIKDYDYVILSGSLPRNIEADIYNKLASIAQKHGVFVALDTSGPSLLSCINSGNVNLIKPNIDELIDIYPNIFKTDNFENAVDDVVKNILKKVDIIALSLGEKGSKLYTKNLTLKVNAPKIDVKSSVGAGDSFLAGLIAGFAREETINQTLTTAVSWAASKLTKYGPGLSEEQPPQDFVDKIMIVSSLI